MIEQINNSWNWQGFTAIEIIQPNDFGNIIFKTDKGEYWRIIPEGLCCEKIASTENQFIRLCTEKSFIEDWRMQPLVSKAKDKLGELTEEERFCLKISAILGGSYDENNLGKISFLELIAYSGDLTFQIKDLEDGQPIEIVIENKI